MTSHETKTHPELTIVTRILQQASIPLTPTQFDQQWAPAQLRAAFQWTGHLSALFLSLNDTLSSSNAHVLAPQRIVKSFLRTHPISKRQLVGDNSDGNSRYNDFRSSSSKPSSHHLTIGIFPTEEELLNPSYALQRRLLCNPGLTSIARVEILTLNGTHQQSDTLSLQLNGSSIEINRDALVSMTYTHRKNNDNPPPHTHIHTHTHPFLIPTKMLILSPDSQSSKKTRSKICWEARDYTFFN
jgi:hypothetical protein